MDAGQRSVLRPIGAWVGYRMTYGRPSLRSVTGYTPGEQPVASNVVKLNTNENPYPPAEAVLQALRDVPAEALRKYPSALATPFREQAATTHGLRAENVIATNGGDELLRLAFATFVERGTPVGVTEPTYSLYGVLAALHGSPLATAPLTADGELPADVASRWNDQGAALALVVNPHAPLGTLTSVARLADVAEQFRGVLLVDEAYVDFVDPALGHDAATLLASFENVLLLRTLSKGYSLAGLRYGYGLGHVSLVGPMLTKTKDSYNVDAVAQTLATVALVERAAAQQTWELVRRDREVLRTDLGTLGLHALASHTNFLLATIPDAFGGGAAVVYETLKTAGVLVRFFDQVGLRDKLRITVGTPAQNARLVAELRRLALPDNGEASACRFTSTTP